MPAVERFSQGLLGLIAAAIALLVLWVAPATCNPNPPNPNPLAAAPFYVQPDTPASQAVASFRAAGDDRNATLMMRIASRPQAIWLAGNSSDLATVSKTMSNAKKQHRLPVFVVYNIPDRDCGSYSRGGAESASAYRRWINRIAKHLGSAAAGVILEPDTLLNMSCRSPKQQDVAYSLLRYATSELAKRPRTAIYLDAGNAAWNAAAFISEIVQRLRRAGVANIRGFALNVSNFISTPATIKFGNKISRALGGKHYVIDTSRNGRGALFERGSEDVCNPAGRGLGVAPTVSTGSLFVDAYLWVKTPGYSDGSCQGDPPSGTWWPAYALALARNANPA